MLFVKETIESPKTEVVTSQSQPSGGCGCGRATLIPSQKDKIAEAILQRINKTKNSTYKTKTQIFM